MCGRAFAVFLILSSAIYGQENRASIAGQVTDPTGAAVPGAKIKVTSIERGISQETSTTDVGRYQVGFLDPGTYTVTVDAAGFKAFVRENVTVVTGQKLGLDVSMEVGSRADHVTVNAEAPALDTESASRGQLVGRKELADIPSNGRVFLQSLWIAAGVVRTTNSWGSMGVSGVANATNYSINGGRSGENEMLLDGVSDVGGDRQTKHIPSIETLQEVKITTNPYDAQYGRTGGGVVSLTTKAGSNELHGVAWDYYLATNVLQANLWAYNRIGAHLPVYHVGDFGFEADGPVYLPKVFNGRNKLFFLFTYEGSRQPLQEGGNGTLPQPEQFKGDFSKLYDRNGNLVTIYDPTTTQPDGKGGYMRTPFSGNLIPPARINAVAAKAYSFYPQPTRLGDTPAHLTNFVSLNPSPRGDNQIGSRMDWMVNDANHLRFRYSNTPYKEIRGVYWGTNAAEPSGNAPLTRNGVNWSGDWTSTLGPTTVFDLRFGLTRFSDFAGNSFGFGYDQTQLGLPANLISQLGYKQFPAFGFSGTTGYVPIGSSRPGDSHYDYAYSLQPNINLVRGAHVLKIGAEFRRLEQTVQTRGQIAGAYTFTKDFTQANPKQADASSGNEFASFLLGYPNSGNVDNNMFPAYKGYYYAGFIQDDWKVSPRLTLNLGFRYDYEAPLAERYNRQVRGFAFDSVSPLAAQAPSLNLKGGLLFAGNDGNARQAFNRDLKHFQPRAGFAYRLGNTWAVRGGFGLFYLGQFDAGPGTGFSQSTPLTASVDTGLTPRVTLSNPFPEPLLRPIGSSLGLATNLGLGISAQYLDRPLPYSEQVSLGFEHQLPKGFVVESAYSGNFTRRLPVNAAVNNIPASQLGQPAAYYTQQVPNPFAGLLPNGPALNGATIARQYLLVPFPQYSGFTLTSVPIGYQNYHGWQTTLRKRFAQGFTFQAAYTVSKALEAVSFLNAQDFNLAHPLSSKLEYRLTQYDTPQKVTLVSTYELPLGRGKALGKAMPKALNLVAGGWQLNGNFTWQRGFPIDFPNASPVAARSAALPADKRTIYKWFDTSLWTDPNTGKPVPAQAAYTLRTWPTRFPDVRFTNLRNLDLSLFKDIPIHERLRFNLRLESYNVTNSPWFSSLATTNVTAANFGNLTLSQNNQPRGFQFGGRLIW
jgi:hypothetical protein